MTETATAPLTERDYRAIRAINWGTAKHALTSPLHYHHALTAPREDTAAMRLGRAMHALLPTREEFDAGFAVYDGTRRGKEWEAFRSANDHREILTATEAEKAETMAAAVLAHPRAAYWIGDPDAGQRELALQWTDRITGLDCKGRVDWVSSLGRMVEFKTTSAQSPRQFFAQAEQLGYIGQAAFYTDGLRVNGYDLAPPVMIVVQTSAPYDVWPLVMTSETVAQGRDLYNEALAIIQLAMQTDDWHGYARGGDLPFERPSWAEPENDDN